MPFFSISAKPFKKTYLSFIALSAFLLLGSCSKNAATGKNDFTPFMPQSSEKQIGAEEHRNIVNQFGGEYNNPKLKTYVQNVAKRITSVSELESDYYTVTLLNSPIVNAFAVPGGYLYITRGLLMLANTEAELAGVLGHEAGHITARHSANQSTVQGIGQIGAMLLGGLMGNQQLGQLAQVGLQGIVASHSRSDEYEADMLGVRYLSKANYNPYAQADFLNNLRIYSGYEAQKKGQDSSSPSFFSTHPDTGDRVQKAANLAQSKNIKTGDNGRLTHLKAISGMIWGDDPAQGFVRDNTFIHPDLGFEFKVPSSFIIQNGAAQVTAQNKNGALVVFDMDPKATNRSMSEYLQYEFAKGQKISSLRRTNLKNVKDSATALTQLSTNRGTVQARLFALRGNDNKVYRFIMGAPSNLFQNMEQNFGYIASNFRTLSKAQTKNIRPFYIRYRKINRGDSFSSLARLLPIKQNAEATLRTLNGFSAQGKLPSSGYIKIISSR